MMLLVFDKINALKCTFVHPTLGYIKPIRYNSNDTIYFLQLDLKQAIIDHDLSIEFTEQDLTLPPPYPPNE